MKRDYAIIVLAIAIAFSGIWIGQSLKDGRDVAVASEPFETDQHDTYGEALSLKEAAQYLGISEDEILMIIAREEKYENLISGTQLSYTEVFGKTIFKKSMLNSWLEDASKDRRSYTNTGIQFNE